MTLFDRDHLFGGLRALAKKLRRRRSSSSKRTSPPSASSSYPDHSTSSSSSSVTSSSSHRDSIRRVFAEYDKDGDGRISLPELTHMVQAIGDCQSVSNAAAEAAAMMEVADLDGDGYIGFQEFEALMATSPGTASVDKGDDGGHRPQRGLCGCPEQGWGGMGPGIVDEDDIRLPSPCTTATAMASSLPRRSTPCCAGSWRPPPSPSPTAGGWSGPSTGTATA